MNVTPPAYRGRAVEGQGWNPWRALRGRDHLELAWGYLDRGRGRIEQLEERRRRIVIDARLERRERAETLGHELIHDEFDLLWPRDTPAAVVASGERFVERENVKRFLPRRPLARFVAQRVSSELAVEPLDVAEEFDVTEELASKALDLLANGGLW